MESISRDLDRRGRAFWHPVFVRTNVDGMRPQLIGVICNLVIAGCAVTDGLDSDPVDLMPTVAPEIAAEPPVAPSAPRGGRTGTVAPLPPITPHRAVYASTPGYVVLRAMARAVPGIQLTWPGDEAVAAPVSMDLLVSDLDDITAVVRAIAEANGLHVRSRGLLFQLVPIGDDGENAGAGNTILVRETTLSSEAIAAVAAAAAVQCDITAARLTCTGNELAIEALSEQMEVIESEYTGLHWEVFRGIDPAAAESAIAGTGAADLVAMVPTPAGGLLLASSSRTVLDAYGAMVRDLIGQDDCVRGTHRPRVDPDLILTALGPREWCVEPQALAGTIYYSISAAAAPDLVADLEAFAEPPPAAWVDLHVIETRASSGTAVALVKAPLTLDGLREVLSGELGRETTVRTLSASLAGDMVQVGTHDSQYIPGEIGTSAGGLVQGVQQISSGFRATFEGRALPGGDWAGSIQLQDDSQTPDGVAGVGCGPVAANLRAGVPLLVCSYTAAHRGRDASLWRLSRRKSGRQYQAVAVSSAPRVPDMTRLESLLRGLR